MKKQIRNQSVGHFSLQTLLLIWSGIALTLSFGGMTRVDAQCIPATFSNKTTAQGLGHNIVIGVYAVGSTVYAATGGGLAISTDGGNSFSNKTTAQGLGHNIVYDVYAVGSTVYAATDGGLAISTNGGNTFSNKTTAQGLGDNRVNGVYVVGSTVYAATDGGLAISTNGGNSFSNKTTAQGLGHNIVIGVYAVGSTVYAATFGGLSISTDGGNSFSNRTTAQGLGHNVVSDVYVVGSTVYAATAGGLAISTNGGNSFSNKTTAQGLGHNVVYGVYAVGSTVYAATNGGLAISSDGGNSFSNKTTVQGLGHNIVYGVYAVGSTVYAATNGGLAISSDGGNSFSNKTTAQGLGHNIVIGVYAVGSTVYAATGGGLAISTDGGNSFSNKTTAQGLGHNIVYDVYAVGSTVYAATDGGLAISTNGGNTFSNKTTAQGLGDNRVNGVYVVGSTVYAATDGGLAISTNGGNSFSNKTTAQGLGHNIVIGVYAVGSTVYAATFGGLSISTDGGNSFSNRTTAQGLGHNVVSDVYVVGSTVYAATAGGLAISTNGGNSFSNKTTAQGLGHNVVYGVYAVGSTVYAATNGGLAISTDGGNSFSNKTTVQGLGHNIVYGVYAVGSTVYAATNGGLSIGFSDGACLNSAPTITTAAFSPITRQQGAAAGNFTIATVNDAETPPSSLNVEASTIPAGITVTGITNNNGTISASLAASCSATLGNNTVVLQVSDGALTATANLLVNVTVNTPPVLGNYAATTITAGTGATVTPSAAPSDNGTVASVTVAGVSGATVNALTGVVTIPNTLAVGGYPVTVTATDNCGVMGTATFTLTVNAVVLSYEADVAPRPNGNGNGAVSVADWTQTGRFVAGLDSAADGSEFQRADSAPRASFGDGKITIADWVQAGRYAAGLDPVVVAAGPTSPAASNAVTTEAGNEAGSPRLVRAVSSAMLRGQINSLSLQFNALGNENALGFSVSFDPRLLSFYRATTATGTTLTINQKQQGQLGLLLAASAGQSFAAGLQTLVTLEFIPNGGEDTVTTGLRFGDQVIQREAADVNATALPDLSFAEADITISGRATAHVSAASYVGADAASDSMMSAFGAGLATVVQATTTLPLPQTLGGTSVTIQDSAGNERAASLFFVSPQQVNYLLPAELDEGLASVTITNAAGVISHGLVNIGRVAPAVFSADASGNGWAAADVQRIRGDGAESYDRVARFDPAQNKFIAQPIELRADEQAFLVLYGTGLKNRSALSAVKAHIGGLETEVLYAGPQGQFAGLDQLNIRIPSTLRGRGEITVELEIDGHFTNPVKIFIK